MSWTGEYGRGVNIGPSETKLKEEMFKINKFNLLASDRIALNRSLPDVRLEGFALICQMPYSLNQIQISIQV